MFTDDTTLLASSKRSLVIMLRDVRAALSKRGLNLNLDKCAIQTNSPNSLADAVQIEGCRIPIVDAHVGFKILGTVYTLAGKVAAEIKARVCAAWEKNYQLWPLLGKRDGCIRKRLRIFDMTVSQTLLWCSESWLITESEKRMLRTTQNHMLRRIAGPRRAPNELWIDWLKRSTRIARKHAEDAGIRFWLQAHLRSKWSWAGHVARMDAKRLARRAMEWRDSEWQAAEERDIPASLRLRRPGRTRWFRWEDELRKYAQSCEWPCWKETAKRKDSSGKATAWQSHSNAFIQFSLK